MTSSSNQYLFGVKIYTGKIVTQNASAGLYSDTFGDATSQFDITNPTGDEILYTWDGTGTDPNFLSNGVRVGDFIVINSTNFNAANNGTFKITGVTDDAIRIDNASGVVESNKTLGAADALSKFSEFRWLQAANSNIQGTWQSGIITKGGIGAIAQTLDLRRGGNTAQVKGLDVTVTNVLSTGAQMWKAIDGADIKISGLLVDIFEFDVSVDPAGETTLCRGICESPPGWTETKYKIPIRAPYYKRSANIATQIDNSSNGNRPRAIEQVSGQIIPVTFGELDRAGFIQTAREVDIFTWEQVALQGFGTGPVGEVLLLDRTTSPETDITPVIYQSTGVATGSIIQHTADDDFVAWTIDGIPQTGIVDLTYYFQGQYVHVMDGTAEDQFRQIDTAWVDASTSATERQLNVAVTSSWEGAAPVAGGADQSWYQIEDIYNEYESDIWPMDNFLDTDMNVTTGSLSIYNYEDDQVLLPSSTYAEAVGADKNKIDLQTQFIEQSIDKLVDFRILPVTNLQLENSSTLEQWGLASYQKARDGLYFEDGVGFGEIFISEGVFPDYIIDKDFNTSVNWKASGNGNIGKGTYFVLKFQLPTLESNFEFDSVYLGVEADTSTPISTSNFSFAWRRFIGDSYNEFNFEMNASPAYWWNLPDFYYSSNRNFDFYFYKPNNTGTLVSGYSNFELSGIDSRSKYNSVTECAVFVRIDTGFYTDINFKELAFIYKRKMNSNRTVFSPLRGRIYNDTWDSRVTSTEMIDDPIDIMEHTLRLQNWSEVTTSENFVEWGKSYSPEALINTAAGQEGGFDYPELDVVRTFQPARQIVKFDEAWTDKIVKSLCRNFFLAHYRDNTGQENVVSIRRSDTTITDSLTLADIIPGSLSELKEIKPEDVFTQPYVRYNKNNATGDFRNLIRVTNVQATTFDSSYVSGYTGAEAEEIWERAHALYLKWEVIEEPPSELTELDWITQQEDAKQYLFDWLDWMGAYRDDDGIKVATKKRITFKVAYERAFESAPRKPWQVGKHIEITLPHQTDGSASQAIIEGITFNVETGTTTIDALLYDVSSTAFAYYIQDSYNSYSDVGWDDVQDSYQTESEQPSQDADWQDAT